MKKTGFNGNVFDFSVDYDATEVDDIVDIHKYLMKNTNIELTISSSFASVNSLSFISMSNPECKTTPQVVNFLVANICDNKQRWNNDKCWCECKELIDKGVRHKGFIWNPSICECECDKTYDVGEYLYYDNCKCR